jgi:shikimate kinase
MESKAICEVQNSVHLMELILQTETQLQATEPLLIVITGPVGGGKSTTSTALAQALRRFNVSVAVIDLDQVYGFVRQQEGYDDLTAWARSRSGTGALATALFSNDMSVVIVDGEFFNAEELNTLLTPIPSNIKRHFFTLKLSYEEAFERVQGDPSRGASKDPIFLQSLHTSFAQALPFLEATSLVIETGGVMLDQVVTRLVAEVKGGESYES